MATGGHATVATADGDHQCKPCGSEGRLRPADVHCVTCGQYQCVECSNMHQVFQFMYGHDIRAVQHQKQSIHKTAIVSEERTSAIIDELKLCHQHGKTLEVYCCIHNEMCCSMCTVQNHGRCTDRRAIEEFANESPIDSWQVDSKIDSLKTRLLQITENIKRRKSDIERKMDNIKRSINQTSLRVDRKIILSGNNIVTQAREQGTSDKANLRMAYKQIDTVHENCQEIFVKYNPITSNGTIVDCFKAHVHFISDVKNYTLILRESNIVLTNMVVRMNRQLSMLLGGTNQFVVHAIKHTSQRCSSGSNQGSEITRPLVKELIKVVDLKNVLKTNMSVRLVSVEFLSDNRIVALDDNNKLVILLDIHLTVIGTYVLKGYNYRLYDVAVMQSDDVVVSHQTGAITNSITTLSTNNNIISVCETVKTHLYESVCVLDESLFIASRAGTRDAAVKVDINKSLETYFSKNIPKKKLSISKTTARLEYIASKKMLVVAHMLENKIDFWPIDNSGRVTTVTDPNIKCPRGMCVGPMDCVFVCCYDSHKVVQITHDAQIVCCYSMTNLPYPMAISITKDDSKMVVTSHLKGKSLGIFTLQKLG